MYVKVENRDRRYKRLALAVLGALVALNIVLMFFM